MESEERENEREVRGERERRERRRKRRREKERDRTTTATFLFCESLFLYPYCFSLSGWAISSGPSKDWHYRLSIYYAKLDEDSRRFVCKTPFRGKENYVEVVVTGECEIDRLQ